MNLKMFIFTEQERFKMTIITEKSNPNTLEIDISSTIKILEMINNEDKTVAFAVEKKLSNIAKAVDIIVENFNNGGRLLYFGAGTSGRLGVLDASECPPTFGVLPEMVHGIIAGGEKALTTAIEGAEDDTELAKQDFKKINVKKNDTVVCISASGNPKYLLTIAEMAKKIKSKIIVVTSNRKAKLIKMSNVSICVEVGEEVITGSSRMKSGTAQKMVLNMLTTASMIKLGKTYKNFMVDLKATNEKLKNRAVSIVCEIANCDKNIAFEHLKNNNFNVKSAIAEIIFGISYEQAIKKLSQNDNILRKTIQ